MKQEDKIYKNREEMILDFNLEARHYMIDFENIQIIMDYSYNNKYSKQPFVDIKIFIIKDWITKEDIDKIDYLGNKYYIKDNSIVIQFRRNFKE